jgi:hypothetical protein
MELCALAEKNSSMHYSLARDTRREEKGKWFEKLLIMNTR